MKWLSMWWYRYLFSKPSNYYNVSRWYAIKCRLKNHPNGWVWYNPGRLEPDCHCKDCGDELG